MLSDTKLIKFTSGMICVNNHLLLGMEVPPSPNWKSIKSSWAAMIFCCNWVNNFKNPGWAITHVLQSKFALRVSAFLVKYYLLLIFFY